MVDAGSRDGTAAAAATAGATVVTAPGSRAEAMNAGAAAATGDVLLFLHADTLLPAGAAARHRGRARRRAAPAPSGSGFDRPRPVLERLVNLRSRLFKVVYGDQALFASRAAFERVGGFRPIPIMEDRDLAARLRRAGGLTVVPLARDDVEPPPPARRPARARSPGTG